MTALTLNVPDEKLRRLEMVAQDGDWHGRLPADLSRR